MKAGSSNPLDTELTVLVRATLAQSIERATQPAWRIVALPVVLGAALTLAMMAPVKWL